MRGDAVYNLILRFIMCIVEASSSYPKLMTHTSRPVFVVHLGIVPSESANLTALLVTHHEELDHADEDVEEVELKAGRISECFRSRRYARWKELTK